MKVEPGMTAVVTGAASGIGYGIAQRALELEMQVVLADVEESALNRATGELAERHGDRVECAVIDVSEADDWAHLKQVTGSRFGTTDVLFNNAGVSIPPRRTWEVTLADWQWLLDVNLWGVVLGLHTFLPEMVQRDQGYVVNTASMSGLLPSPRMAPYAATKHAVVGLSETLFRDLDATDSGVGVSVICPGRVDTRIFDAARNRKDRYGAGPERVARTLSSEQLATQMEPYEVGRLAFDAIEQRRFWVLTHPDLFAEAIRARGETTASQENPDERSADPWIALSK